MECPEMHIVIQRVDKPLARVWVHNELLPSQYLPEVTE